MQKKLIMLNYKPELILPVIAGCLLMAGCKKNVLHTSDYLPVGNGAQVKVVFMSTYKSNPKYQVNINGTRVSNVLSASGTSPNPTPFPGGGLSTGGGSTADYLGITAGQNTVSIAIPKFNTNTDSVQLATSSFTYESGKKYSLYFTDTAANSTSVLVTDSLARPDSGYIRYKFVNLMPD